MGSNSFLGSLKLSCVVDLQSACVKIEVTFHPGWALWISVFPYLLLEAILLRSIRAFRSRLKPVVESPN